MVDIILITISCISLVIWFVQEKYARPQLQENLDKLIESNTQCAWWASPAPTENPQQRK